VLGVQVIGDGATDLVHLGQAAIATAATAEFFVEQIFNFPTMTEGVPDRRIRRDQATRHAVIRHVECRARAVG